LRGTKISRTFTRKRDSGKGVTENNSRKHQRRRRERARAKPKVHGLREEGGRRGEALIGR